MADTPSDRPAVAREPDSAAQPEALAAPAPTTAPPARTASSAQQRQQGSTASTDREAAGGGTPSHAHAAPDLAAVEPAETGEFGALEVDVSPFPPIYVFLCLPILPLLYFRLSCWSCCRHAVRE